MRHLLSVTDISGEETRQIIRRAREIKGGPPPSPLAGKSVALVFEKPSLRTRTSFEVGIARLGGHCVYLGPQEVGLGSREPASDVARVLSGYVDCIIARVFSHGQLEELAAYSSVPVINALSDWEHPCQIVADLLTIDEHTPGPEGLTLTFIGDGNNVARSLLLALPAVGMNFAIASPPGYNLDAESVEKATGRAAPGATIHLLTAPEEAVAAADVVYTDVWASMGQEAEAQERNRAFEGYTVGPALMATAKPGAIFMHDMPAHYGEEVAPGMLDHAQSVAYLQAHNRLHAQNALLEFFLAA